MADPGFVDQRIAEIGNPRRERIEQVPRNRANAQALDHASVSDVGISTADVPTHEVFSRALRDPRAMSR